MPNHQQANAEPSTHFKHVYLLRKKILLLDLEPSERTATPCLFAMISEVVAKVVNDVMEAQLLDDVCFLPRRPIGCIFRCAGRLE
jgi:hypothetical protein